MKKSFKGIISEKYFVHNPHIEVKTNTTTIDIYSPSSQLIDSSHVGDSIVKMADQNKCYIIKGRRKILMDCWATSSELRNSKDWPKGW